VGAGQGAGHADQRAGHAGQEAFYADPVACCADQEACHADLDGQVTCRAGYLDGPATCHAGPDGRVEDQDGRVVLDGLADPVVQDTQASCHVVQEASLAFVVQEACHDDQEACYAGLMACPGPSVSDLDPALAFLPLAF